MTPEEREHLRLFLRAAAQVRDASLIAEGNQIVIQPRIHPDGSEQIEVHLLQEEPFRSLALSIRLVYLNEEPGQFYHVSNILSRDAAPEVKARVADIRAGYSAALRHPLGWVTVESDGAPKIYNPEQVLRIWMNGVAFHQDAARQDDLRALQQAEGHFRLAVQSTALLLAGRIMDLDDQVADFLNEPQMPRIPGPPPRAAAV